MTTPEEQQEQIGDAKELAPDNNNMPLAEADGSTIQIEEEEQVKESDIPSEEMHRKDDPDGFTKRINKVTARAKRAEEIAALAQQEASMERQQRFMLMQQMAPQVPAYADPNAPQEPQPGNFPDPHEFTKAYTQFQIDKARYANNKNSYDAYKARLENEYSAKAAAAREKYGDDEFDESVQNVDRTLASLGFNQDAREGFYQVVKELDNAADVAVYLGKIMPKDELVKLTQNTPNKLILELGKISERVNKAPKVKSEVPTPPRKVVAETRYPILEVPLGDLSKNLRKLERSL